MPKYKVIRRWFTVQEIEAEDEDEAFAAAEDQVLLHEDFNEEEHEVKGV